MTAGEPLKQAISERRALLVPGAANALTARIIEDLGFEAIYLTGAGLANTELGVPDIGLGDAMPDPANIPAGCRFNPRCRIAVERCHSVAPTPMVRAPQGMVECHLA